VEQSLLTLVASVHPLDMHPNWMHNRGKHPNWRYAMSFRGDWEALVLAVLRERSLHGYEIAKRLREQSQSVLEMGEGRLYPTLHRLEEQGFVRAEWVPQEGRPPRKVYEITRHGLDEFERHRSLWEKFAVGVAAVMAGGEASRG
jgi:PadR family transcriptional regulator, regulatory protein PadR